MPRIRLGHTGSRFFSTEVVRILRYNDGTLMISGRIGFELALVAVLCVLTIFLFPAMQGPYPVVNGPATALQAARAALRVQIAIVQAAFNSHGKLPDFAAGSCVLDVTPNYRIGSGRLARAQHHPPLLILLTCRSRTCQSPVAAARIVSRLRRRLSTPSPSVPTRHRVSSM